MTGNRVTIPKALVVERRRKIWQLRMKGWTYEAIAKKLGISDSAVSKALNVITKRYSERHMEDVDRIKAEQVASLEQVASEAYRAWLRSKKKKQDEYGDPRYLVIFMKAKEDIRKIVGADAPKKVDVKYADLSNLSDDELIKQAEQALIQVSPQSSHGNDIEGEIVRTETESVDTATGSAEVSL